MSSDVGQTNLRMSPEEYAKRLWDWTPLNDSFPRGIQLTDIDGEVEVGGEFLSLEGKPAGFEELPRGQRLAFFRKVARGIRVVVIEGSPPRNVVGWHVLQNRRRTFSSDQSVRQWTYTHHVGDYNALAEFVRRWAMLADSKDCYRYWFRNVQAKPSNPAAQPPSPLPPRR